MTDDARAANTYYDHRFSIQASKVLPGEYYVTEQDELIVTTLGSCIAACIRDRETGVGGMNHFMLPDASEGGVVGTSARYGAYAMELLINELLKLGARRSNLESKVFGGGNVLSAMTVTSIGDKNSRFVLNYLKFEGIPVIAQDLLDIYPRKVYFWPKTGRVLVKKLRTAHNTTIVERERDYSTRLHVARLGETELWNTQGGNQ